MESDQRTESSRATQSPWVGLAIITLGAISVQSDKSIMALLFQPMKDSLHFTDTQMGLLQGTSGGFAYLLAAIPMGLWIDRGTRVRIFLFGSLLWSVGTLATGLVGEFNTLFLARFLVGVGGVVLNPAGISLIADWFAPKQRGTAWGLFAAGVSMGTAVGAAAGGAVLGLVSDWPALIAMHEPWRWVHIAFGISAFIVSGVLLLVREPTRHESVGGRLPVAEGLHRLWAHRHFFGFLVGGMTFSISVFMSASIWAPAVLSRTFHLSPVEFASWLGLVLLIAGVGGSFLGGFIAQVWGKGEVERLMKLGSWISLLCIPAAGFATMPSPISFGIALLALLLFNVVARIQVTTALAIHIPNELRGLAMGVDIFISASIGLSVAPAIVGVLSDHIGESEGVGLALLMLCAPSACLSGLFYYLSARSVRTVAA